MTIQEVFEKVCNHLMTQKRRALLHDPTESALSPCAYRAPNGDKCAAGCLILDELYESHMEGKNTDFYSVRRALLESDVDMENYNIMTMVRKLQTIHDFTLSENWAAQLRVIAEEYTLEIPDCLK